ncbi:MAG: hypothetical protein II969_01345 [Anaerolineaceae bacterium]|nr:hypothetical protein [Anaerolineaceae bacterium]
MSWLDDRIAKDMKDPEFKKEWEKNLPAHNVVMYMLENDIPFTQEFLDTLDALAEKGVTFELATSKPEESIPELELT